MQSVVAKHTQFSNITAADPANFQRTEHSNPHFLVWAALFWMHSNIPQTQHSLSGLLLQDALGQQHAEEHQQHHITLDKEFGVYSTRRPKQWWEFLQHQGNSEHGACPATGCCSAESSKYSSNLQSK
jgi:hypothetical protein